MSLHEKAKKFLPLTEATYYIMLSLTNPLHGYGIMQNVEDMTKGTVKLGPGTLYGAISKLLKSELINEIEDPQGDSRRKCYILSELGLEVIKLEHQRVEMLYKNGKEVIEAIGGEIGGLPEKV